MNQETVETESNEIIDSQINSFIIEHFKYTEQEVKALSIQRKMAMVDMKSEEKWNEFKLGLRKAGYII
jgi:hypothetical protein